MPIHPFAALAAFMVVVRALCPGVAHAQAFPSRPITLNVPFAPGSPQDLIMRALSERAAKDFGQPIVIDNKPGAAATIAASALLQAKPDGYTLAGVLSTLVIVPQMQKVPFEPTRDFTYIMQIASFPLGIAVKADSPFKSWADVVTYAKANPEKVSFGTPGAGTNVHLGMVRLAKHADIKLLHVPHVGAMAIIPAVLGGHVTLMATGTEWKPQVDAGLMRLLMTWTATRHPSFPDVPTMRESGMPFDAEVPFGLLGPKGMDPAVTSRLHDGFKKALGEPEIQVLIKKYDIIPRYASGEAFRASMEAIGADLAPVIEGMGLKKKE